MIETWIISFGRVIQINGRVAGYVIWTCDEAKRHGKILNIAVKRDFRGRGAGRAMMIYALQEMRAAGMSHCDLEVRESNHIAKRLYESLGMRETGRIPNYYDTEDAIIYSISF